MADSEDVLVLENFVLRKEEQTPLENDSDWKNEFALD
jgi:carbamoyltransferase